MTQTWQNADSDFRAIFQAALNREGHPFQYAVLRRAHELNDELLSPWHFETSEFPVEVQGVPTRLDFVLSRREEALPAPICLLVGECKRANPSLADWVFVKAPYVGRGGTTRDVMVEYLRRDDRRLLTGLSRLDGSDKIHHLALEVKSGAKGDSGGTGRGAIEKAATQLTRGVNGLIECLAKHRSYLPGDFPVTFVPAIFTTAKVWTTDVDLAETDLVLGQIELGSAKVTEVPWLWLQYHVSPGLMHTVDRELPSESLLARKNLSGLLELEYARTIAVVGSSGIDDFLTSQRWMF